MGKMGWYTRVMHACMLRCILGAIKLLAIGLRREHLPKKEYPVCGGLVGKNAIVYCCGMLLYPRMRVLKAIHNFLSFSPQIVFYIRAL